MKTIEEKAKAYDEALERARKEYKSHEAFKGFCGKLVRIFPELVENNDEKIINIIKEAIESKVEDLGNGVTRTECLAWLEKQGEQKSISCCKKDEKIINFLRKCVQQPMGTNFLGDIRKADVLDWLEKQASPVLSNSSNNGKDEHKSAWSEEDEKTLAQIEVAVLCRPSQREDTRLKCLNWLKSLKDRVK